MLVSVILGHPKEGSFNHQISKRVIKVLEKNDHKVFFHDLYKEDFDPVLRVSELEGKVEDPLVRQHCEEIEKADGIVVIHPNWWGQPPAIVKGWVDRVLRLGLAYDIKENGKLKGLLKTKVTLVFNTSDTPKDKEEKLGNTLEHIWNTCTFSPCGIKNTNRKLFAVMSESNPGQMKKWLQEVEKLIDEYFPKDK